MVNYTKPDEQRPADQSTYTGLFGLHLCTKAERWTYLRQVISDLAVVSPAGWQTRLDQDQPGEFMARRVRETYVPHLLGE